MKSFIYLLSAVLFLGMTSSRLYGQSSPDSQLLVAGDAVRIQVWDIADDSGGKSPVSSLSGEYGIDPNGNILMPFVGPIYVAGKTADDLAKIIKNKYADMLREPFIYIRPLIRVVLAGSVAKPGSYHIDSKNSLWDLLDMAGGPTSDADLTKMQVRRGGEKVKEDLLSAFENAHSLHDVDIQTGDQIIIPRRTSFDITKVINYFNFAVSIAILYLRLKDRGY